MEPSASSRPISCEQGGAWYPLRTLRGATLWLPALVFAPIFISSSTSNLLSSFEIGVAWCMRYTTAAPMKASHSQQVGKKGIPWAVLYPLNPYGTSIL